MSFTCNGFSKREREINRYYEHPRNLLINIFHVARKSTITIAGSTVEGMRGGIYSNQRHGGDDDLLGYFLFKEVFGELL
jgi:hypothetical protein